MPVYNVVGISVVVSRAQAVKVCRVALPPMPQEMWHDFHSGRGSNCKPIMGGSRNAGSSALSKALPTSRRSASPVQMGRESWWPARLCLSGQAGAFGPSSARPRPARCAVVCQQVDEAGHDVGTGLARIFAGEKLPQEVSTQATITRPGGRATREVRDSSRSLRSLAGGAGGRRDATDCAGNFVRLAASTSRVSGAQRARVRRLTAL